MWIVFSLLDPALLSSNYLGYFHTQTIPQPTPLRTSAAFISLVLVCVGRAGRERGLSIAIVQVCNRFFPHFSPEP